MRQSFVVKWRQKKTLVRVERDFALDLEILMSSAWVLACRLMDEIK